MLYGGGTNDISGFIFKPKSFRLVRIYTSWPLQSQNCWAPNSPCPFRATESQSSENRNAFVAFFSIGTCHDVAEGAFRVWGETRVIQIT